MQWDGLSQNVQCHSQAVGHRKRCDETTFHKMCNVTDLLLAIGKRCDETTCSWNVQCHSLPIWGYRKSCDENAQAFDKMCNVTHILLDIGIRSSFEVLNQHDMLTSYIYRNRCDFTAFHKMCNITHNLWKIMMCPTWNCSVAEWPASLTSF